MAINLYTSTPRTTTIKLKTVKHEIDNVYTFSFTPEGVAWRAGQYLALIIPEVSNVLEQYEHWFTISSAPHQKQIDITVRESTSPFKKALFAMKSGDTILSHTVDGDFAWPSDCAPIFIAAGIGITPYISMLRQQLYEGKPVDADLFYFNRNDKIIFEDELNLLRKKHPGLNVHYVFEKPLSLTPIAPAIDAWRQRLVFLAGPVPMVDRLGQELRSYQIPYKQDFYFGYDITNY